VCGFAVDSGGLEWGPIVG